MKQTGHVRDEARVRGGGREEGLECEETRGRLSSGPGECCGIGGWSRGGGGAGRSRGANGGFLVGIGGEEREPSEGRINGRGAESYLGDFSSVNEYCGWKWNKLGRGAEVV